MNMTRARMSLRLQPILLLVLFLSRPSPLHASYPCRTLTENTWQNLRDFLETPYTGGIVALCAFTISGDGCPTQEEVGYTVSSRTTRYVMCDPLYPAPTTSDLEAGRQTGCIIDCPGIQFDVADQASLTLERLTIKGSTRSAVRVGADANLTVFSSHFEG